MSSNDSQRQKEKNKYELEEQFLLRLPEKEANDLKNVLHSKPKKVKKMLKISLNSEMNEGVVHLNKKVLNARVFDLPCHVESLKTTDRVDFYKTADISKIVVCKKEPFENNDENNKNVVTSKKNLKKYSYPHGLTPPLKNVRKRRFRKVLKNKIDLEDVDEIEKEVLWLLRMDVEAVSSRYELIYDNVSSRNDFDERSLFGEISDCDSDEENRSSTSLELSTSLNIFSQ
ncbi:transcription initiation factor TFIID subunit 7-like [Agrilus planipennis]|uniref:Transcription initiation factor TFIID subunit 7-like n=1 Tax=Agrilus planipennis TaxID=224129 RepID=A0A1W4XTL7_AGRPL|nr:transcription initiation factor TFIID subunit 7-like [Agrilus planipennis]